MVNSFSILVPPLRVHEPGFQPHHIPHWLLDARHKDCLKVCIMYVLCDSYVYVRVDLLYMN